MANGHGGKRNGAGRKPGSFVIRTREEAAEIVSIPGKPSPLRVLAEAMWHFYDKQDFASAAAVAKDIAPYLHPKLSAVTHAGDPAAPLRVVLVEEIVDGGTQDGGAADPPAPDAVVVPPE